MSYTFGKRSSDKLETVSDSLQRVAHRALSFGVMDFSVTCGHRTTQEQNELYLDGKSQLDGVNKKSKHQLRLAIDIMPYPAEVNGVNVWNDEFRWIQLSGLMLAAAAIEGVNIRWGGDFDSDGNNVDNGFIDYPHYEIR